MGAPCSPGSHGPSSPSGWRTLVSSSSDGLRSSRSSGGGDARWGRRLAHSPGLHALRAGKTRGMGAGRKLRLHRREERWADKDYKKSHLGSEWKKPFAGASHAKGIVLEKM